MSGSSCGVAESPEVSGKLFLTLLRITLENRIVSVDELSCAAAVPRARVQAFLRGLERGGFLSRSGRGFLVKPLGRMAVALQAIRAGVDVERAARFLSWREFEQLAVEVLEANGYCAAGNFRFKHGGRRFEVDVAGYRGRLLLCVDCKHWLHGWSRGRIRRASSSHMSRVRALSHEPKFLRARFKLESAGEIMLLPMLLTLADVADRVVEGVPIVSILRFRSFLHELPSFLNDLAGVVVEVGR